MPTATFKNGKFSTSDKHTIKFMNGRLKKEKSKYITAKNYKQFKPSEFVRSFISDIEVAEESRKKMNMSSWYESDECLPCLGGMACMNLGVVPMDYTSPVGRNVATLGDAIRNGDRMAIEHKLASLYGYVRMGAYTCSADMKEFDGIIPKRKYPALKNQIEKIAADLEAQGL